MNSSTIPRARTVSAPSDSVPPGGEPRSGGGGDAPPCSVHRETSFRSSDSAGADEQSMWRYARRLRYQRRQVSSSWLIGAAREAEGKSIRTTEAVTASDDDWVRPPRAARCRWRCAVDVGVHGDSGGAHFTGLEQCASIWACPVCASVIRADRSVHIARGVERWQAEGNGLLFVTLTIRHTRSDPLEVGLNAVLEGFGKMIEGRKWLAFSRGEGVLGQIRAAEVTHGGRGWHPHVHALFFVLGAVDEKRRARWAEHFNERWPGVVVALGADRPRGSGVQVQAVGLGGDVVGKYLSKLQDDTVKDRTTPVAKEISRADYKRGRGGSITPFELLSIDPKGLPGYGLKRRRRLWLEYVASTKGRQCITWGKKLAAWYLDRFGVKPNRSEEKIIADQETREFRFLVPGHAWDERQNSPLLLTAALEHVEADRVTTAMALLDGFVPDTVDLVTGEVLGPWHGEDRYQTGQALAVETPTERAQLRVWSEGEHVGHRLVPCRRCLRPTPVAALVLGVCAADDCWPVGEDSGIHVRRCLSCGVHLEGLPLPVIRCGWVECSTEDRGLVAARGLDIALRVARAGRVPVTAGGN